MNKQILIDLRTFSKQDDFPAYAALYCSEQVTAEAVFCLTSNVMQWSERIWLLDLRHSENFWRLQQQKLNLELFKLLQSVLETSLGEQIIVVFSYHPWPSLFFLDYLFAQSSGPRWGAYSLNSRMSQNLYENISWAHWFAPLERLTEKLAASKVKGFNAGRFRSQQAQLQRFIERMQLWGPYDLSLAKVSSLSGEIERRYSVWLARVWRWTFEHFKEQEKSLLTELDFFPWLSFELDEIPQVKRLLEYPISQWDVLEPLLKQDFERLCHLSCWSSQERVQRLDWTITLFNFEELKVELSFRNPYHLHPESPEFKTALYQAYYAYSDMMKQLQQRDTDLDLPLSMPFLSWRLEVRERLLITPAIMELFPDCWDSQVTQDILELQNKLPTLIEAYQINPDFNSEQLFKPLRIGEETAPSYAFSLQQWQVRLQRPLFYYKQPQALTLKREDEPLFLERTANNWWENEDLDNLVKDYFILKEPQGLTWWIYKNSRGEWFKHGIYS